MCKIFVWGLCTLLLICFLASLWRCIKSRREDFKFELINDDLIRVKTDLLAKLHRNIDEMLGVILEIKKDLLGLSNVKSRTKNSTMGNSQRSKKRVQYRPRDEKAFNIIMEGAETVKARWSQITMKELDTM